jgi:hypothetical protein
MNLWGGVMKEEQSKVRQKIAPCFVPLLLSRDFLLSRVLS